MWGACLKMQVIKKKRKVSWCCPSYGVLKFNVDGAAKEKPELASTRGILGNHIAEIMYIFYRQIEIKDSNDAKVSAILEAHWIYCSLYHHILLIHNGEARNFLQGGKDYRQIRLADFLVKNLNGSKYAQFPYRLHKTSLKWSIVTFTILR